MGSNPRDDKNFPTERICACVIGCILNLYHPEWAELSVVLYYNHVL